MKKDIIIIIMISTMIFITGCIETDKKEEKEEEQEFDYLEPYKYKYIEFISYNYTIKIDNNRNPYEIKVLFPINEFGYLERVFENITILEGNCSIEMNNSIKGIFLIIIGESPIRIQSKIIQEGNIPSDLHYDRLSMTDYENITIVRDDYFSRKSWCYSNNNVNLEIKFEYYDGFFRYPGKTYWGSFGEWSYSGSLKKGWQELEIKGFDAKA